MEFNTTEESATLMSMEENTTDADLYEEVEMVLQILDIPVQKLWNSNGWSSRHARKEQWRVFACRQRREEYNEPRSDLTLLDTPRNVYAKIFKRANAVMVVSKLVNFVR
jgi:hypothetical protein